MRAIYWLVMFGVGLVSLGVQTATSSAAIIDPSTLMEGSGGNTQFGAWNDLSAITVEAQTGLDFPGHPGTGAWPGNVLNQTGAANSVYLTKVANSPTTPSFAPYFASVGPFTGTTSLGRMHYAGQVTTPNSVAGTLGVGSTSPLADLKGVVFQLEIAEVFGHTFFNDVLPTFNFNGGSQNLLATHRRLLSSLPGPSFGQNTTTIHTWLLQWDTTDLGPISDFQMNFTGIQHSDIYGLRVDQYDNFSAVPEPSTFALGALGAVGLSAFAVRQRRKNRQDHCGA